MSAFSFLWHDYESTGLNPRRDRPAQFAGIRTDSELNVIGEPINVFCKPLADMVPHLEACLVTGITPQHCEEHGIPDYAFADLIARELGATNTIGVGYNTIKFDDEFTRNLFWRNLMDPYAREWKNGCGRWDIIDVVRVAHALRPGGIKWPVKEDGSPSFKLEHIARENGILHESAHDALSDVMATINVARLVRKANPRLFDYCLSMHKKDAVAQQVGFGSNRPFLHISGVYPAARGGIGMLYPIAVHHSNKNEYVCWDLLEDPSILAFADAASARATLYKRSADLAEGETRLALRTIATNKSPMVFQDLRVLSPELAAKWNIDSTLIAENLVKLQAVMKERNLPNFFRDLYARETTVQDPEDDLYGAFISEHDRVKLNVVRQVFADSPEMLAAKMASKEIVFADRRLDELVLRFRARHAPHTLSRTEHAAWMSFATAKVINGVDGHHTVDKIAQAVHAHPSTDDDRVNGLLTDLADYADTVAAAFNHQVALPDVHCAEQQHAGPVA